MEVILQPGGARALWQASLPDEAVGLAWLGQAGFALRHAGRRWLIDPYLSDHLARKYAGTEFPHERMPPPPLNAEEIRDLTRATAGCMTGWLNGSARGGLTWRCCP